MTRRRLAMGAVALALLAGLAIVLWPDDDGEHSRTAGRPPRPTSTHEAEGLVRDVEPRAVAVRCRPSAGDWKCSWKTPTQSCEATLVYGRDSFWSGCSRLVSETDSIP